MSDTTTAPSTNQRTILVYCLNAPEEKDLEFRDAIRQHLKPIIRKLGESGVPLEILDDDSMLASTEIEVHRRRLDDAHIVLALLSSAFIDDDDIYDRSLPVLERAEAGQLRMISILVRNFNWKDTPFADWVVLPENERPLNSWPDKDDAVTAVVKEVGDVIKTIAERLARNPVASPRPAETERPPEESAAPADPRTGGGRRTSPRHPTDRRRSGTHPKPSNHSQRRPLRRLHHRSWRQPLPHVSDRPCLPGKSQSR